MALTWWSDREFRQRKLEPGGETQVEPGELEDLLQQDPDARECLEIVGEPLISIRNNSQFNIIKLPGILADYPIAPSETVQIPQCEWDAARRGDWVQSFLRRSLARWGGILFETKGPKPLLEIIAPQQPAPNPPEESHHADALQAPGVDSQKTQEPEQSQAVLHEASTEPANSRQALLESFRDREETRLDRRVTNIEICKAMGYRSTTGFYAWLRSDPNPKKLGPSAARNIERFLTEQKLAK